MNEKQARAKIEALEAKFDTATERADQWLDDQTAKLEEKRDEREANAHEAIQEQIDALEDLICEMDEDDRLDDGYRY